MTSSDGDNPKNLTDFQGVKTIVLTGIAVEFTDSLVMFVGWTDLPNLGSEDNESRIETRFGMPLEKVRGLFSDLGRGLRKGSH